MVHNPPDYRWTFYLSGLSPQSQCLKFTQKVSFIFPQKKPAIYKASTKETEKSSILNQKDFIHAKETIKFIKDKKWNSALKSASKVKDREFRNLITWMYLKTTRNGASFSEYKNFIEQNNEYPRINRIRFLAEEKIYLRNNSPTSIINWFEKYPPLGGMGKVKLAEAYLEQDQNDKVNDLIKYGGRTPYLDDAEYLQRGVRSSGLMGSLHNFGTWFWV